MTRGAMRKVTSRMSGNGAIANVLRSATMAAASLALAGCISIGGEVPEQLFRLTPETTAQVGSQVSGRPSDAIFVLDPEADRSLDVLRVPVRINDSSIAYLKDASWVEKPSRQFRSLLAETLRAETGRLVIEGGDFEHVGDLHVDGRLLRMGYDVPSRSVIVRFDATLGGRDGKIVTRRFESVVSGIEPKAKNVGPALNRAANDVARQIAAWIKTA